MLRFLLNMVWLIFLLVAMLPAQSASQIPVGSAIKPNRHYEGMVHIPQGKFKMGTAFNKTLDYYNLCKKMDKRCKVWWFRDERPQRTVILNSYWIDVHEVTNQDYLEFVLSTGHRPALDNTCKSVDCWEGNLWDGISFPEGIKKQPVIQVSWYDAQAYCRWLSKRLPSEAEWEKAARGPNAKMFPWGDAPPDTSRATYKRKWRGYKTLTPIGSHPAGASIYKVHDMAGNAWEWVADWYELDYYHNAPKRNPKGPKDGRFKLARGGSWVNLEDTLHSAYRRWSRPEVRFNDTGFRCAKDAFDETQTD